MPRPRQQSGLRAPLNDVLGSRANVRLLRALTLAGTSLSAGELARRAELGRTSVYPALTELERTGIVEFVGVGATRQVRIRKAHPLAAPIGHLFQSEARRIDALVEALRDLLAKLDKALVSAWLKENLQSKPDDQDTMIFYIVADVQSLTTIADQLEDYLVDIERTFQVHLEVVALTRSEVKSRIPKSSLEEVILLAGVPPIALLGMADDGRSLRNLRVHGYHDAGSRWLALALATKVRYDPSIRGRLSNEIRKRMTTVSDRERRELREWLRILSTMPPAKLQRFLVDDSERAVRLRQSLPALGLFTAKERDLILGARSEQEVIAAVSRAR